jgi:hypothetical protein
VAPAKSSRRRYLSFADDDHRRRLDDERPAEAGVSTKDFVDVKPTRREYVRVYLTWLRPHGLGTT